MASRGRPRSGSRPTGLIVASAIALMLAGIVLIVAINNKTRADKEAAELPLDISANPPGGPSGDVVDISAQATGRFQAVDKDDPARVAWELLFSKLDPIGAGVYRLTEPRAWIYLKDGQTLFVRADSAQIKKPAAIDGQIESGEFTGNTIAMVFPARRPSLPSDASGTGSNEDTNAGVWDPDRDIPWLLARTESVKFDTVLLELSTETPIKISTRESQFDGRSMLVRGNQVRNRLEYLKIGGPGTLRYTPHARSEDLGAAGKADGVPASQGSTPPPVANAQSGSASRSAPDGSGEPPAKSAHAAHTSQPEEFYRAVFTNEVVLVQTGRKLNADVLELWLRTIDNKMTDNAFGGTRAAAGAGHEAPPPASAMVDTLSSLTARLARVGDTNTPLDRRARLRLVADVSIAAGETLFRPDGEDIVLDWAGDLAVNPLSQRPLELAEDNELLGRFTAPATGRVRFRDQATGAIGQSGIVEYAATTRVLTLRADAPRDLRRAWVHMPGSGLYAGERVDVPISTGKVRMTGAGLLASVPDAERNPDVYAGIALASPDSVSDLSKTRRITWSEKADFEFATRKGLIDDQLRSASFIGAVRAADDRSMLEAEQMTAEFVRADTAPALADDATVALDDQPSRAPSIRVFGPGRFKHTIPESERKSPTDAGTFEVSWTRSMFFDDASKSDAGEEKGRLECDGDAVATASGPFSLDVLKSHRIHVDLSAATGRSADRAEAVVGDRRVLRVEAIGSSYEREDGKSASIESRRYAPGAGADGPGSEQASRRLEQIVYLDGPRIIANDVDGTLTVPSEGRALFVDQRMADSTTPPRPSSAPAPGAGIATGDPRGTTKFEWKGSMVFTRATGIVHLLDNVEMIHKPIDNQPFARMTCNELEALVGTGEPAGGSAAGPSARAGKLVRATAMGNVYIESQDRKKLIAERAVYDAERSIVEATAGDGGTGNLVSMFDEKQAAPMIARRMRWDLAGDRIEITEPAPTTVPR